MCFCRFQLDNCSNFFFCSCSATAPQNTFHKQFLVIHRYNTVATVDPNISRSCFSLDVLPNSHSKSVLLHLSLGIRRRVSRSQQILKIRRNAKPFYNFFTERHFDCSRFTVDAKTRKSPRDMDTLFEYGFFKSLCWH